MKKEIQQRLVWIKLYEQTKDFGLVYRRCGISRSTLRKGWDRYIEFGIESLLSQSRRPHNSPTSKVTKNIEELILALHHTRDLGARRLQSELLRVHEISLSIATIHKLY